MNNMRLERDNNTMSINYCFVLHAGLIDYVPCTGIFLLKITGIFYDYVQEQRDVYSVV